jgi:hypothetical protein
LDYCPNMYIGSVISAFFLRHHQGHPINTKCHPES